jgi:imidazolonepropionase-like amidohydrolase
VAAPEGALVEVHDFPEATILPGLVDVHTHLNYPGDGTHTDDVMSEEDDILLMQSIVNARLYLAKGVTTIRDNGAKNHTTLSLRKGMERGLATGPRLSICVNPLTITGGHMWQMGAEADGIDEVVKGVRRLVKLGADYIKVAVTGGTTKTSDRNRAAYNLDELKAIVSESHKFGRLVAGHAHATAGIVNCLDSGIDMIIHCSWNDADGSSTIRPEVVERIAETGSWVNPTLDQVFGAPREKLQERADTVGLNAAERQLLDGWGARLEDRLGQINRMVEGGARFVTGTDCGWGPVPFSRIHKEMDLLVQGGLTPMQAVVSATQDAADSLGLLDELGTLEVGKQGDVAVFNGEPHRDVNDIVNVAGVFHGGVRIV